MKEEINLVAMVREMTEGLRRASYNKKSLLTYLPHEKQMDFHTSPNRGRLFIGGNRSGKTVSGAVEMCMWLTHKHPWMDTPLEPIRARCVSVDFTNGVEAIVKPEIMAWLPKSELINGSWEESYDRVTRTLTLANGSFLEFKSYDQDLDKHAGTSRHCIWFDEEPPKHIFEENMLRLVDTDGKWWLTMTPVEQATWTLYDIYEPAQEGLLNISVTEINTEENPHINVAVLEELMGGMDEDTKLARRQGKYVHGTGLIFPNFDVKTHVLDEIPEKFKQPGVRIIASMDHGFGTPSAWLWHAVTPDGDVLTFHEMVGANITIPEWARKIKEWESRQKLKIKLRVGDPAIKQRTAQTGLDNQVFYRQHGIAIALASNETTSAWGKMRYYLDEGKWHVMRSCAITIKEFRKYRLEPWDSAKMKEKNNPKEKARKKDDHCMDSARYFFSFMPELRMDVPDDRAARIARINEASKGMLKGVPLLNPGRTDPNFDGSPKEESDSPYDETIGGCY